jgi:hypothetical protein
MTIDIVFMVAIPTPTGLRVRGSTRAVTFIDTFRFAIADLNA